MLDEIKQLAEVAPGQPAPQSFTDKAKAAGKYALDAARQKQLGMKRDSLITNVGKAIYEKHLTSSGPVELVGPIASAIARDAQLEIEISQHSAVGNGSLVTPKRMLVGVGLSLALFAAYLVMPRTSGERDWNAESEAERAAAISKHEPQFLQMLQAGDSAWDAGKKPEAVQHYTQLLAQFCGHGQGDRTEVANLHKPDMARAAGRAIDFLADGGNDETAKDLIRKADQSDLVVVYSSSKVNRLVKESKADQQREDKEIDDWLKEQGQNDPSGNSIGVTKSNKNASATKDGSKTGSGQTEDRDKLVERIQIGIPRSSVINILGQPDSAMPLGQGQAMLYYLSDTEAFFISIDKNGKVFSADRQNRSK